MIWLIVVYILSLLIASFGALKLLFEHLNKERRFIEKRGHAPLNQVKYPHVVGGVFVVLTPVVNTIIACIVIMVTIDRPIIKVKSE